MSKMTVLVALCVTLAACAATPIDATGKLPAEGLEAARYVEHFCALDEQGRNGQQEALRRALWPSAQLIILCDR